MLAPDADFPTVRDLGPRAIAERVRTERSAARIGALLLIAALSSADVRASACIDPQSATWIRTGTGAAKLEHRAAGLRIGIDASGLRAELASESTPSVEVRLRTSSFGRRGSARPLGAADLQAAGDRLELAHPGLREWYANAAQGVEHGWTVTTRPAGSTADALWIGLEFEGLHPRIFADGLGAALVDEHGRARMYYRSLDASDASGRHLDARLVASVDGVGIAVRDEGAAYPITIDPLLSSLAWSFETDITGAELSSAITAGDVNGDGYSDILVGAAQPSGTNSFGAGRAWAFYGHASLPSLAPDWTYNPGFAGSGVGYLVTCLGDVNGDGVDDVAVSAKGYSNGQSDEGAVFLFRGSASGLEATPWITIESNLASARLCVVGYVGDTNGDGTCDLFVGCQGGLGTSFAAIYSVSASGLGPQLWNVTPGSLGLSNQDFQLLRVRAAGDVNADGRADFLISTGRDAGHAGPGMLFLGGSPGPSSSPAWVTNASSQDELRVAGVGDVNGDGFPDVLVGQGEAATAWLYLANPNLHPATILPTTPSATLTGGLGFGHEVGPAGDLDGDGYADALVSTVRATLAGQGLVGVYPGMSTGLPPTPVQVLTGSTSSTSDRAFGDVAVTAGDVNGDGYADVIVSEPTCSNGQTSEGRAHLFLGGPSDTPVVTPVTGATTLPGASAQRFGASISICGDVNGDGFSDALVGLPSYSAGQTNEGRVELHMGSPNGPLASVQWAHESNQAGAFLGSSVAFAGDVDNDGFVDVIVGAPAYSNGQTSEGAFFLFRGTATGVLSATPAFSFESNEAGLGLGTCVASAGDVNGDGRADVVVGAPGSTSSTGKVFVFLGNLHYPSQPGAPILVPAGNSPLVSSQAGDGFGTSVAGAGDVDGDGFTDIIVGAPHFEDPPTEGDEGRVLLFRGSSNGIASIAAAEIQLNQAGPRLGASVSAAGDTNGDGVPEVIVGAPGWNLGVPGGEALVYTFSVQPGGGLLATQLAALHLPAGQAQAGAEFGATVAFAGDLNGDMLSDVAVGAPAHDGGGSDAGAAFVFLGSSSGPAALPAWSVLGLSANANCGSAIGSAGDDDGDGFTDFLLGSPGASAGSGMVGVYTGSTPYATPATVQQRRVSDTVAVALLCSLDTIADVKLGLAHWNVAGLLSTTICGRERIRLEWELKPMSAPLDGSALSSQPAWSDSSTSPNPLRVTVAGLSPGEGYHWRSRIALKNPLFSHTRWQQLQGNSLQEKKFGTGFDCNNNGTPDEVELAGGAPDCNLNGVIDSCDIASGMPDCNGTGTPDACDLVLDDCNQNGVPDECDVAPGGSSQDCNGNFAPDECDIALGLSEDTNQDGVPDECQGHPTLFCFGDGAANGGPDCPCANNSLPADAAGCLNSFGLPGRLRGTGVASLAADNLLLLGDQMPATSSVLYIQGQAQTGSGLGIQNGDGLLCVSGALKRLGLKVNSGGASQWPAAGDPSIHVRSAQLGDAFVAGATRHYSAYYRNPTSGYCTIATYNFTNALSVTWSP